MDYVEQVKEFIPDPRYRIKLHDLVASLSQQAALSVTTEEFSVNASGGEVVFRNRLQAYEDAVKGLLPVVALIGRWGEQNQSEIVTIPPRRFAGVIPPTGGNTYLLEARWYPVLLLLYAASAGSVLGASYDVLYKLAHIPVQNSYGHPNRDVLLTATLGATWQLSDAFKLIKGLERSPTPISDHLFAVLQPCFESQFYLGTDFEDAFNRTEALLAVEYIHIDHPDALAETERPWGPAGRFLRRSRQRGTLASLISEAKSGGKDWPPARSGLFGGSNNRFIELAEGFSRFLSQFYW